MLQHIGVNLPTKPNSQNIRKRNSSSQDVFEISDDDSEQEEASQQHRVVTPSKSVPSSLAKKSKLQFEDLLPQQQIIFLANTVLLSHLLPIPLYLGREGSEYSSIVNAQLISCSLKKSFSGTKNMLQL